MAPERAYHAARLGLPGPDAIVVAPGDKRPAIAKKGNRCCALIMSSQCSQKPCGLVIPYLQRATGAGQSDQTAIGRKCNRPRTLGIFPRSRPLVLIQQLYKSAACGIKQGNPVQSAAPGEHLPVRRKS